MDNIGKLVGSYFFIIGSIAIIIGFITSGRFHIDLSFLVIGYFLYHHHKKARKFTLILCGIGITLNLYLIIHSLIFGFTQMAGWKGFGISLEMIGLSNRYLLFSISMILFLIPFLNSKKAKIEFEENSVSS